MQTFEIFEKMGFAGFAPAPPRPVAEDVRSERKDALRQEVHALALPGLCLSRPQTGGTAEAQAPLRT